MKITKRQLKRIIREERRRLVEQGDFYDIHDQEAAELAADYEDRFDDDQKDMDYYLAVAIEKAVGENPAIAGLDLVDLVKQDSLFGGTTRDDIFNMLDEMIEDGTLWGDFEEDAWYLANDTPHGVMSDEDREWDII